MATKPAIVTQKQLDESGFDNLRDYLNAQRGLTRRDGQVAMRKGEMDIKSPAEKRSATRMADVAEQKSRAERRSDTRLRDSQSASASASDANMLLMDSARSRSLARLRDSQNSAKETPDMSAYKPLRSPEPLTSTVKPGTNTNYENPEGMKKGGSVRGWGMARGARKAKIV